MEFMVIIYIVNILIPIKKGGKKMAKLDLRNVAKNVTVLSVLMEGREKIETGDLVKQYPDGISVCGVDIVETSDVRYSTVIFAEDTGKFYNGGMVLTKIVDAWLGCGTLDEINVELQKNPVKMKLSESKTKKGNKNVTIIDVL